MSLKRNGVRFEADGKEYQLRFSTNAMVAFQEDGGDPLLTGVTALEADPANTVLLRQIFWAGLSDQSLSKEDAGDIMGAVGQKEVFDLIGAAIKAAFPEIKKVSNAGKSKAVKARATAKI